MAAPTLRWYDNTDTLITTVWSYPTAAPGSPTAGTLRRLYNNQGGAPGSVDDAVDWYVQVQASLDGEDPFLEAGLDVLDGYWIEVRQRAQTLGGLALEDGPWLPLGPGRHLAIPVLEAGQGVEYEFRVNVPAGTTTAASTVNHTLRNRRSVPVPAGLTRTAGPGVSLELGEHDRSLVLDFAGVLENPAGANNQVHVSDLVLICRGRHVVLLEELVTLDANAADGALGAGESYIALLYVTDSWVVTTVKGNGATVPAEPATPADALLDADGRPLVLAAVTVDETAVHVQADIEDRYILGAFGFRAQALDAVIGPGRGVVGDRLVEPSTEDLVSLTASVTRTIWRRSEGTIEYSVEPPVDDPFADSQWRVTTDVAGVTALEDLRRFAGFGHELLEISIRIDGPLTAGMQAFGWLPLGRGGQLLPLRGVEVLFDDAGAGTSLSTILDVNYANPGGAFATLFTSQGADDRRPTLAFNGTNLHQVATWPEVVDGFRGACRFRVDVDAVPAGGAGPAGVTVRLQVALTGPGAVPV